MESSNQPHMWQPRHFLSSEPGPGPGHGGDAVRRRKGNGTTVVEGDSEKDRRGHLGA